MAGTDRNARAVAADRSYVGTGPDREGRRQDALAAWASVLDRIEDSIKVATDAVADGTPERVDAAAEVLADATPTQSFGPLPAELHLRARKIIADHQAATTAVSAQMDKVRRELEQAAGRTRRGNPAPTGLGTTLDIDA